MYVASNQIDDVEFPIEDHIGNLSTNYARSHIIQYFKNLDESNLAYAQKLFKKPPFKSDGGGLLKYDPLFLIHFLNECSGNPLFIKHFLNSKFVQSSLLKLEPLTPENFITIKETIIKLLQTANDSECANEIIKYLNSLEASPKKGKSNSKDSKLQFWTNYLAFADTVKTIKLPGDAIGKSTNLLFVAFDLFSQILKAFPTGLTVPILVFFSQKTKDINDFNQLSDQELQQIASFIFEQKQMWIDEQKARNKKSK